MQFCLIKSLPAGFVAVAVAQTSFGTAEFAAFAAGSAFPTSLTYPGVGVQVALVSAFPSLFLLL